MVIVIAKASATSAHERQDFVGYEYVLTPWGYYEYRPIYNVVDVPMTEGTNSKEGTLTAVFVNHSDTTQVARFGMRASINGNATSPLVISPVPEPGTWAMMLAGVAMVGACVRRTRRAH